MLWRCEHLRIVLGIVVLALVLSGCTTQAARGMPDGEQSPAVALKRSDGPDAPDWTLETLDGGEFRLADHRGEVVVMFFMASWCGTCVPEARALAQLHRRYGDEGLTVVAINVEPR